MRKAAKCFLSAVALLSTLVVASCGDSKDKAKEKLSQEVSQINKDLPAYMRRGYTLDSVTYRPDDNSVRYYFDLDTAYVSKERFVEKLPNAKEQILKTYDYSDTSLMSFLNSVVKTESRIVYEYRFTDGHTERVEIKADDIKTVIDK